MSGRHHQRTGWTYGPRPRATCNYCLTSQVIDTHRLIVTHRLKIGGKTTVTRCIGSQRPPVEDAMPETPPSSNLTNLQDVHTAMANAIQAFRALAAAMKTAGLTAEDDSEQEHADTREHLARALDIPQAALTGPSPDGMPDHWTDAAPLTVNLIDSCPTCYPRACDTSRSECHRRYVTLPTKNAQPPPPGTWRSDEEATIDGATD